MIVGEACGFKVGTAEGTTVGLQEGEIVVGNDVGDTVGTAVLGTKVG